MNVILVFGISKTKIHANELLSESSSSKEEGPKKGESSAVKSKDEEMEIDYTNVTDTDFLKSVLEQLPGVDTQNEEVQDAIKSSVKDDQKDKDKDKKKDAKKWTVDEKSERECDSLHLRIICVLFTCGLK